MRKYHCRLAISLVLALSACVPLNRDPVVGLGPASDEDFAPWQGNGPATLEGQALLTTIGGDVKTCAGSNVTIVPANNYVLNVLNTLSLNKDPNNVDYDKQTISEYTRSATCDAQGNFEFDNVPDRTWIVIATVIWHVVDGYVDNREGGDLAEIVNLKAGLNRVVLAQGDLQQQGLSMSP